MNARMITGTTIGPAQVVIPIWAMLELGQPFVLHAAEQWYVGLTISLRALQYCRRLKMKARSYPYLHIAKKYGIDYSIVLNYAHNCFSRPASALADLPAACREEILNAKWEFQLLAAGLIPYATAPRVDRVIVTMDDTINDMAWVLDAYATACGIKTNGKFFNSQKVMLMRLVQQWVNANAHLFKDDVL